MQTAASARRPAVPTSVRVVQVVCLIQAVALMVVAVVLALELAFGEALVRATAALLVGIYALLAVFLVLAARQFLRGKGTLRGALVTWWLLAGISVVTIDLHLAIAITAAMSCLVGLVALLWPTTREHTRTRRRRPRR